MKRIPFTVILPLLVVLTILASLISPAPVLAAGEPPPPPAEKNPKNPALAPANPAPPTTNPAPASTTAGAPAAPPSTAPGGVTSTPAAVALSIDALAQAGALLVGPSGNPMPMAARDTVNVLVSGPVYFKSSAVAAECASGFCYYASLGAALAAFPTRSGLGTIYASGTLSDPGPVDVINSVSLNLTKLTGLAWDGTTSYTPWIVGSVLTIQNMLKGFTVDGFYIFKGISASGNAGTLRLQNLYVTNPAGNGINVTNHKGNIDLFNVTVEQASNNGAVLDNTAGTGNITITNSSFNNNTNWGLIVHTKGSALLDRVEASNNVNWNGANVTMVKGVTVKDSRFNGNLGSSYGLIVDGSGPILLQNVEAKANTSDGVYLHTANDITINGGVFNSNAVYGLEVVSSGGNITLSNVSSADNGFGVLADNSTSATPKTVTVNSSSFIHSTSSNGLMVKTKGNITLNNFYAANNMGSGVYLDNAQFDGSSNTFKGSGAINILNTAGLNQAISNGGYAILAKSKGAITIKGVHADGNFLGLLVNNCAPNPLPPGNCLSSASLSLSALDVENSSFASAIYATTGGAITLDKSVFDGNAYGVYLDNSLVSAAKAVTVTNSMISNTPGTGGSGLTVTSKGNITLNNVQALTNHGVSSYYSNNVSGILLDNCMYSAAVCTGSGSVSVLSSLGSSRATGNNLGYGLFILSKGAITVNGFASMVNGAGAFLRNETGTGAVTIANSSFLNNTSSNGGLIVYSAGNVSLKAVDASHNIGGSGAVIHDAFGTSLAFTLAITSSRFNQNHSNGLVAESRGNMTLNNVTASFNDAIPSAAGAQLTSWYAGVTVLDKLGANQFSNNSWNGLVISAYGGAISVSGVSASFNISGQGIWLDNSVAVTPKPVLAQKITTLYNGLDGIAITSKGSVTLNKVQANYNTSGYGVFIDTCGLPAPCEGSGNVSLLSTLGPNNINSNAFGLWIYAPGSVLVNDTTASNNLNNVFGVSGAMIENDYVAGKTATVNRSNFNGNSGVGLEVAVHGIITLNNVGASLNQTLNGYGVYLFNAGSPGLPGINILSTSGNNQFNGNASYGLYAGSSGNIVLSKVIASDNGFVSGTSGALLQTFSAGSISITCSAFNHNKLLGLQVTMGSGVLSFKSVAANNNQGGADVNLGSKVPVMSWTVCGH